MKSNVSEIKDMLINVYHINESKDKFLKLFSQGYFLQTNKENYDTLDRKLITVLI